MKKNQMSQGRTHKKTQEKLKSKNFKNGQL